MWAMNSREVVPALACLAAHDVSPFVYAPRSWSVLGGWARIAVPRWRGRPVYAPHALLRAILDHVPPLLGLADFRVVG